MPLNWDFASKRSVRAVRPSRVVPGSVRSETRSGSLPPCPMTTVVEPTTSYRHVNSRAKNFAVLFRSLLSAPRWLVTVARPRSDTAGPILRQGGSSTRGSLRVQAPAKRSTLTTSRIEARCDAASRVGAPRRGHSRYPTRQPGLAVTVRPASIVAHCALRDFAGGASVTGPMIVVRSPMSPSAPVSRGHKVDRMSL